MAIKPAYHEERDNLDPIRFERPFTKRNWKNPASRERWKELHQRIGEAKSFAEWRSAADGETDRQCAIIHVNNRNREKWLRRMNEFDFHYRDIRYSEPYDGFSHKHYETSIDNPNRITYAVISQDEDVVEHVKQVEQEEQGRDLHDVVGEYLGFPQCCRDHFDEVWTKRGVIDPMYEVSCNSDNVVQLDDDGHELLIEDPNPGANVMWRYFGLSFVTHIPCSWDCEGSIDIARERYRIMTENGYQEAADALSEWLNSPHVWDSYHGITNVRNKHVTGATSSSCYWDQKIIKWKGDHATGGEVP